MFASIPLREFELHIDETILNRGLSYCKKGYVTEFNVLKPGKLEFIVSGSENYKVLLEIDGENIRQYSCTCPYDQGPVCKHIAASIFFMQKEELEIKVKAKGAQQKTKKKNKTVAEQVDELLEKVSHKELISFVKEKTKNDPTFRSGFLAAFSHKNSRESKALYAKQIRSVLRSAAGRSGFIYRSDMYTVDFTINQLLENATQQVKTANYKSAFWICTAIMEELNEALQFADDSDGSIGYSIERSTEIISEILELDIDNKTRIEFFDYCIAATEKQTFYGWDWYTDVIQLAAKAVKTDKELEKVSNLLDNLKDGYDKEIGQLIYYNLLVKLNKHSKANEFIEKHLNNSNLREIALQNEYVNANYEKVISMAQMGIENDKEDKPGLVKKWYNWLLKVAQAQNDTDKIIAYARYLFIDFFMPEQDYYQVLKKAVTKEKWTDFVEGLIVDLKKTRSFGDVHRIAQIYIKEGWLDRLMEMVRKDPSLNTLDTYSSFLKKEYSQELIELYAKATTTYLRHNVSRSHYKTVCRYLVKIAKLGGVDKTRELDANFRKTYPMRRALIEELNKL